MYGAQNMFTATLISLPAGTSILLMHTYTHFAYVMFK